MTDDGGKVVPDSVREAIIEGERAWVEGRTPLQRWFYAQGPINSTSFGEHNKTYHVPYPEDDLDGLTVLEPREQFDPCIVGVVERYNDRFVLYSRKCVIESLMEEDEDSDQDPREAAMEHYAFNILGGWVGDSTPAFLVDDE